MARTPQIKLKVEPATVKVNEPITIDPAGSVDPDGGVLQFSAGVKDGPVQPVAVAFATPGEYELFGTVKNAGLKKDSATVIVTVQSAPPPTDLVVTPSVLPVMTVGKPVSVLLQTTGGAPPYSYMVAMGALPGGLTLTTSGMLSGTPTTPGPYAFGVACADALGRAGSVAYAGEVAAISSGMRVTPETFPSMQVGVAVSVQLVLEGGTAPFGFQVVTGAWPTGVTMSNKGRVSGTPTQPGPYSVTVSGMDARALSVSVVYSGTVAEGSSVPVITPPTITTQPVAVAVQWGSQAEVSVAADGTAPLTYQWYLGDAPMNGQTNPVLRYTPTASGSVWCRVSNAGGSAVSATVFVEVRMPVSPPPTGVGLAYRRAIRMPSMWASFNYGDCTGRVNERGNLCVIFTGDQVNQGSPVYELEITDAPIASWVGGWERPYGGKRGTWMQPQAVAQSVEVLNTAVKKLTKGSPGEKLEIIRSLGTDATIDKVANALAINMLLLKQIDPDGRKARASAAASEWSYVDFDNQTGGYCPIVNGSHFWHPEKQLLYVGYYDTYNVTARPDCTLVALRLLPNGKTEAFGPWRFKTQGKDGAIRYGDRAGGGPKADPRSGKVLCMAGMNSGNASCPWGTNLFGGGDWPDENTPTHSDLTRNIDCLDNYLYSYPMIGQFTNGIPNGPIRSMRRRVDPAIGEWYEGRPDETFADPAKNGGVGSWTDCDGQAGFIPLPDRVIFPVSVAGSSIQDPTNPLAAHVWYSTVLNNPPYTCVHGVPSPVQITGPVRTAGFPGLASYPWGVLDQVKRGEIPDYSPEPDFVNAETQWGVQTGWIGDIGGSKSLAAGPVHNGRVYMIAQHADTTSYPGIAVPILHEFELVG